MKDFSPLPSALEALLDALEADLVAASTEDVQDAIRETGRSKDGTCCEVRSVVDGAVAASEDCLPRRAFHGLDGQFGLYRPHRH